MNERGYPFGQFLLLRQPASPKTADAMPDHDTLYGTSCLDLKATPMVLQVPDIIDRYYSFALLDSCFDNYEYVGSRTDG